MKNTKEKIIKEIVEKLIDEDGYNLFQSTSEHLGGAKDVPVIFTYRATLTLEEMAEIIYDFLSLQKQEIVEEIEKMKTSFNIFGEKDEKNDGIVMGIEIVLTQLKQKLT